MSWPTASDLARHLRGNMRSATDEDASLSSRKQDSTQFAPLLKLRNRNMKVISIRIYGTRSNCTLKNTSPFDGRIIIFISRTPVFTRWRPDIRIYICAAAIARLSLHRSIYLFIFFLSLSLFLYFLDPPMRNIEFHQPNRFNLISRLIDPKRRFARRYTRKIYSTKGLIKMCR